MMKYSFLLVSLKIVHYHLEEVGNVILCCFEYLFRSFCSSIERMRV